MKILYLSDMDIRGSGYRNLSIPLCEGLVARGHEIKVVGLAYKGEEHTFPFTIFGCRNFNEGAALIHNLKVLWKPDVQIVAMDIPIQEIFLHQEAQDALKVPYIGLMPLEADPLCISWAMSLMMCQGRLVMSRFGTAEFEKAGVAAEYLEVGVDTASWRFPLPEERDKLRQRLGIDPHAFTILTVADNQERKHLSRAMEVVRDFRLAHPEVKLCYLMVTREQLEVGWKLRDYATEIGINDVLYIYERGMGFRELWSLYAVSDAFLLTSKAEGLGMPILEAMACGVPVVATNCGAITEHLGDGRGWLIEADYVHRDVYGNESRYMASRVSGLAGLEWAWTRQDPLAVMKARQYVECRNWHNALDTTEKMIERILNEQKQAQVSDADEGQCQL